jgi:putative ABC transport system permease protein
VRTVLTVALRSLLWRRWATLGLLSAAALSFAVAAIGPLWSAAAQDSMLSQTFRAHDGAAGLLVVTASGNDPASGHRLIPAFTLDEATRTATLPAGLEHAFTPARPVLATTGRVMLVGRHRAAVLAAMAWSPNGCRSLALTVGRCPDSDDELTVSARTAGRLHLAVGSVVQVPEYSNEPPVAGTGVPFPTAFRVVGVYRPPATSRRWAGSEGLFTAVAGEPDARDPLPPRTEAAFGTHSLLLRLAHTPVTATVSRFLAVSPWHADVVDALDAGLARWDAEQRRNHGSVVIADGPLDTIRSVAEQRSAVRLASWLVSLQLLALVWYVLFLMTAGAAESRAHDVALAKLRGLRPRLVTTLGVLEPLLVVLAALPIGFLVALTSVGTATQALLPGGVALRSTRDVAIALLVALTGSCLAAGLAMRQAVRERVLTQLQGGRRVWAPRGLLLGEVTVVVLSGAALWQVWTRSDDDGLDGLVLLAPGLAAAGVGVLAARGLRTGGLLWARRTRHRPRRATYLASRRVGRRLQGTRTAVFAAVAVSLAVFAACSWGMGERQRAGQAAMEVGAERVYQVRAPSTGLLLRAVHRIDPAGRHLAAAAQLDTGNPSAAVLAVDTTRLGAVSSWQAEWGVDAAEVARLLRPPTARPLVLRGPAVDVDLTVHSSVAVNLVATLVDNLGHEHPVAATLVDGRQSVRLVLGDECATGCRLDGLTFVRQPQRIGLMVGTARFSRLVAASGVEVPDAFAVRGWRSSRLNDRAATSPLSSRLATATSGLSMAFNVGPDDVAGLVRDDVPEGLPMLATGFTSVTGVGRGGLVLASSLDGGTTVAKVVGHAAVLPRLGGQGALTDLVLASRRSGSAVPSLHLQVWAGPGSPSPAALRRALAQAGVHVLSSATLEGRRAALDRTGPALAQLLLLGMAAAALVVAALAVVALALIEGRTRDHETASLRTAGVLPRTLRRAAWWEYGAQLATGTAAGLIAGVVATVGLGDAVARLGLTGAVAPVAAGLPAAWLLLVLATTAGCFVLVAAVCVHATVRAARPETLRAGPA